ncbi:MAG TPA: M56 family metallopeptidase, partial [Thermoanaerobaculia bacterium]|nr:M56 family metallopeptidase [Thermoanaerobaculia bacterium]
YAIGVVWMLGTLAVGILSLRGIARRATFVREIDGVRVLQSEEIASPLTFHRTILVPPHVADDAALAHELEHVRRCDWMLQLLARVACALWWPHPLVWLAWRRFRVEAERACDDAVVARFEPTAYAQQLVSLARTRQRLPALAMASPTRLAERVHAILDEAQPRGRSSRAALAAALMLMAALASVTLVAAVIPGDGTPLIEAARRGDLTAVRALLDGGADPNEAAPKDGNPLIAAAAANRTDVLDLLLRRGAQIDAVVPDDENALITASRTGASDAARLLIARGADVNARVWSGREWRTPLSVARDARIEAMLRAAGAR